MVSLFPSGADFPASSDTLSYISLTHSRTMESSKFLLNESAAKLFEIQLVDRGSVSNGSFLVSDPSVLVHKTEMKIFTRVDPLLILLGPLTTVAPETGSFMDYMDVMNMMIEMSTTGDGVASMTKLFQVLNSPVGDIREKLIDKFFDSKCVLDRCLVRLNGKKVVTYLRNRCEVVAKMIDTESLVECYGNPDNSRLVALELVRSYIATDWYNRLTAVLGYTAEGLYVEESKPLERGGDESRSEGKPVKRPNTNSKKAREIAKTCMKMTSFFKPKGC
jgi:hypothetical protein